MIVGSSINVTTDAKVVFVIYVKYTQDNKINSLIPIERTTPNHSGLTLPAVRNVQTAARANPLNQESVGP